MRKSTFSETQIVGILKDAESGVPVDSLLRKYGVSRATFFKWRSKYGGACILVHARRRGRARVDTIAVQIEVAQPGAADGVSFRAAELKVVRHDLYFEAPPCFATATPPATYRWHSI